MLQQPTARTRQLLRAQAWLQQQLPLHAGLATGYVSPTVRRSGWAYPLSLRLVLDQQLALGLLAALALAQRQRLHLCRQLGQLWYQYLRVHLSSRLASPSAQAQAQARLTADCHLLPLLPALVSAQPALQRPRAALLSVQLAVWLPRHPLLPL